MRKIDSVIEKSAPYVELLTRLDELEEHLTNLLKKTEETANTVLKLESLTEETAGALLKLKSLTEETADALLNLESIKDRLSVLEKNRTDLYDRVDRMAGNITHLENRLDVLEKNRMDLYDRATQMAEAIARLEGMASGARLSVLEENRDDLYSRIDQIKHILCDTGIINLRSRLDSRIIRLELLWYYQDEKRRIALDKEMLTILQLLDTDYDYGKRSGRLFAEDPYYGAVSESSHPHFSMGSDSGIWYANLDGKRIYLGENRDDAESYLKETIHYLEGNTPHRYLEPAVDGIDVPEGAILLDIGAAEGFFGIRHIEKCKKVYFFEYDERWLTYLEKTCEPFRDKIEIVRGFVGDGKNDIRLDKFFENREKPTFIKMDVEGAEGAVLRGMSNLLLSDDPLTMLICTYHRQEDWERYYEMLKNRFDIYPSSGFYWDMVDPNPPFFRRGIMRAVKRKR